MKLVIYILYVILAGSKLQNAFSQSRVNVSSSANYEGKSLAGNTSCQLTIANDLEKEDRKWMRLVINNSLEALGNKEKDISELLVEDKNNLPFTKSSIKIFSHFDVSIANQNVAKKIFVFLDEDGLPKMIKGVLYYPEYKEFDCGFFQATN
ncbi:MAG: hypothetical protein QE271_12480 [Bacteriovoracaceae bacterium]|nr:hypothetical protein [Bacteriovoracaceae bacterium]